MRIILKHNFPPWVWPMMPIMAKRNKIKTDAIGKDFRAEMSKIGE
jgi:hypothetical protein